MNESVEAARSKHAQTNIDQLSSAVSKTFTPSHNCIKNNKQIHTHTHIHTHPHKQREMSSTKHTFEGIKPGDDTGTTSCVDQIYLPKGSTADGFRKVVYLQWSSDRETGRSTWAVVGTELEATLLKNDLIKDARKELDDTELQTLASDLDNGSVKDKVDKGRLLVITYTQLHMCLREALLDERWTSKQDPANMNIIMDFGWGRITYHMAASCVCLLLLLKQRTGLGSCSISAATVSSIRETFFLDVARRTKYKVLFSRLNEDDGRSRRDASFVWEEERSEGRVLLDIEGDRPSAAAEGEVSVGNGRMILLASRAELEEAVTRQEGELPPCIEVMSTDADDIVKERDGKQAHIIPEGGFTYLGPVCGLGHVLVSPSEQVWVYDRNVSRAVLRISARRSRAQIEHVAGYADEHDRAPEVHCFMTSRQYKHLPRSNPSPSQTVDIDRLLLSCVRVASIDGTRLADLQCTLVDDEYVMEEYLRRLKLSGLVELRPAPASSIGQRRIGRRLLYSPLQLTAIGVLAETLIIRNVTESVSAASLLAQWSHGRGSGQLDSPAITEAIFSIASVLATSNVLSRPSSTIRATSANIMGELDEDLEGVAAPLIKRGCIWTAIAIWHRMRLDDDWRGKYNIPFLTDRAAAVFSIDGRIRVRRDRSFDFDEALDRLEALWPADMEQEFRGGPLTDQELLHVDEMLVRAFVDKLVFIPMPKGVDDLFGYDMVSHRKLDCPPPHQGFQLDKSVCWQFERDAVNGRETPSFFCIYTCLQREVGGDGSVKWIPLDITHVSGEAVWNVLGKDQEIPMMRNMLSKLTSSLDGVL